jgi:hypothetical protein
VARMTCTTISYVLLYRNAAPVREYIYIIFLVTNLITYNSKNQNGKEAGITDYVSISF